MPSVRKLRYRLPSRRCGTKSQFVHFEMEVQIAIQPVVQPPLSTNGNARPLAVIRFEMEVQIAIQPVVQPPLSTNGNARLAVTHYF